MSALVGYSVWFETVNPELQFPREGHSYVVLITYEPKLLDTVLLDTPRLCFGPNSWYLKLLIDDAIGAIVGQ